MAEEKRENVLARVDHSSLSRKACSSTPTNSGQLHKVIMGDRTAYLPEVMTGRTPLLTALGLIELIAPLRCAEQQDVSVDGKSKID